MNQQAIRNQQHKNLADSCVKQTMAIYIYIIILYCIIMFISHQPAIPFYLWTKKHPTACIMVTLELLWTILLRQSKSWKMFSWSKNCFCVPENSNWMTPFSCRVSPILFWWKSVTPPFSSKNSSRANRWSRLVNVLRVWESSKGSNKSSVSAEEALHQRVSSQNAWIFYHYADCQCRDKTLTNTTEYKVRTQKYNF